MHPLIVIKSKASREREGGARRPWRTSRPGRARERQARKERTPASNVVPGPSNHEPDRRQTSEERQGPQSEVSVAQQKRPDATVQAIAHHRGHIRLVPVVPKRAVVPVGVPELRVDGLR